MSSALEIRDIPVPQILRTIPSPPGKLYHQGAPLKDLLTRPCVAIVGSRKVSPYGRQVTEEFAGKLAEQGVVIISGLALGTDAIAHRAALEVGGLTIAVLPSPLDRIAPASNRRLAAEILRQNGALVSEYEPGSIAFKQNFIARNRLMAGLAKVVLITEASNKSGTLHTARFAHMQEKDILAVPGNITNPGSVGTNTLIKTNGAGVALSYEDVLFALGLHTHKTAIKEVHGRNKNEQTILDLMLRGVSGGEELMAESGLDISHFNQVLTMLEISGKIRPLGMNQWVIA